jgi:hypothetical protein
MTSCSSGALSSGLYDRDGTRFGAGSYAELARRVKLQTQAIVVTARCLNGR